MGVFLVDVELNNNNLTLEWPMIEEGITYNVQKGKVELDEDEEEEIEFNNHQLVAELTNNKYNEIFSLNEETYYYFIEALINDGIVLSNL